MTFVAQTVLLRYLTAQAMSFLAMLLPFGALVFGAVLYDETITWRALAGAGLVAAGLLIAQTRRPVAQEQESVAALATAEPGRSGAR